MEKHENKAISVEVFLHQIFHGVTSQLELNQLGLVFLVLFYLFLCAFRRVSGAPNVHYKEISGISESFRGYQVRFITVLRGFRGF